jgi:hypothetical protein
MQFKAKKQFTSSFWLRLIIEFKEKAQFLFPTFQSLLLKFAEVYAI